jgi:hypothetical protein
MNLEHLFYSKKAAERNYENSEKHSFAAKTSTEN